jgi:hypothetical protein
MNLDTKDLVRERARRCCEYCQMPQECDDLPFQIEHVIARVHDGSDDPENLALACVPCNLYKGTNLSGIDPKTGKIVRLFHPRLHQWNRHFQWNGATLEGKTAIGRATIRVLRINMPIRIELRQQLFDLDEFPPKDS